MIRQPQQRELFVSERPVTSNYGRERSYARRRVRTLVAAALVIGGVCYALWGHSAPNPADIPTIKAEGNYKEKPANPGGIDIPHQDVQVYDELDGRKEDAPQVEHLLPPSEMPKDAPHALVPVAQPVAAVVSTPDVVPVSPKDDIGGAARVVKSVNTTVAVHTVPSPVAEVSAVPLSQVNSVPQKPAALETKTTSIAQILEETKPSYVPPVAVSPSKVLAAGSVVIQLASVPDKAKAQAMMKDLQSKYADALGGLPLHLAQADLGSRGVFYRIQSAGLAEKDAASVCASLKKNNAGCILVRK